MRLAQQPALLVQCPRKVVSKFVGHVVASQIPLQWAVERRDGLVDPAHESGIELAVDAGYTHLMVFTGDPLPDVNRRAAAIEPMTCAPNAFQTGAGAIRLEPGETVSLMWALRSFARRG